MQPREANGRYAAYKVRPPDYAELDSPDTGWLAPPPPSNTVDELLAWGLSLEPPTWAIHNVLSYFPAHRGELVEWRAQRDSDEARKKWVAANPKPTYGKKEIAAWERAYDDVYKVQLRQWRDYYEQITPLSISAEHARLALYYWRIRKETDARFPDINPADLFATVTVSTPDGDKNIRDLVGLPYYPVGWDSQVGTNEHYLTTQTIVAQLAPLLSAQQAEVEKAKAAAADAQKVAEQAQRRAKRLEQDMDDGDTATGIAATIMGGFLGGR